MVDRTATFGRSAVVAALMMVGALGMTACSGGLAAGGGSSDTSTESASPDATTQEGTDEMDPQQEQVIGVWTSDEPGQPRLEFMENGRVEGTDGCNGIVSTYEVGEASITIDDFASTLMACKGVDDWLRGVHEVTIAGDEMTVMNAQGEEIGRLQRGGDDTQG